MVLNCGDKDDDLKDGFLQVLLEAYRVNMEKSFDKDSIDNYFLKQLLIIFATWLII